MPAGAVTGTVIQSFGAYSSTGAGPTGTLLRDASGALYGTNALAGSGSYGTVFKLTPPNPGQTQWGFSVLYTFTGGTDGGRPNGGLVMDSSGALYGTTAIGGWNNNGVVFKLTPPASGSTTWTQRVLHRFYYSAWTGAPGDGFNPQTGLIMSTSGTLYGTTASGGVAWDGVSSTGYGVVFKLTPLDAARMNWQETVIYRFTSRVDGSAPLDLTGDWAGNLYGTTMWGGNGLCTDAYNNSPGCGIVFKLSPPASGQGAWTKTTLKSFMGRPDGARPLGKLLLGPSGVLYGTTYIGGSGSCTDFLNNVIGCGTVFRLSPPAPGQSRWTHAVLRDFWGGDGAFPEGGLVSDSNGLLFGTTTASNSTNGVPGVGFVFLLAPASTTPWPEWILYNFNISVSGYEPLGQLLLASNGRLYGTTTKGGAGFGGGGTVFEIAP